ncbi:cyclic nucleotide-binding domain-containing protein [Kaarinaea lacus]
MNSLQALKQLPYWEGVSNLTLDKLCNEAELVRFDEGSIITEQFKSASDFFLLCNGSVDHYVTLLDETQQPLPVGRLDTAWSAIGWSGIFEPHRYTTQVRSSAPSTLLRWNYTALNGLIERHPEISRGLLSVVAETSKNLLEQSRNLLHGLPENKISEELAVQPGQKKLKLKLNPDSAIKYLNSSNLFRELSLHDLKYLADYCWLQRYSKDETVYLENELAADVLMLVKGKINLYYTEESNEKTEVESHKVFVRSLSQPGQIVSWASLTRSQRQDITAVAEEGASLCCIPASIINQYCSQKTRFAIDLHKKLLHIIGSRLRATRALLINQYTGSEYNTITSLLHNLGPQLAINSPLHKVPYLLKTRVTQEDAFHYLDRAQQESNQLENNVASLCSDILLETRRECDFYKGLKAIYQMVTTARISEDPQSIRNLSAAEFAKVFANTRYIIQGEQHLPETGGHIFILNHLVSHPYHKLPNEFEFSLDTHFISSMILYKKYGDSGIRVVRKNRAAEYGHESYYQRLGHIYVYTKESQPVNSTGDNANWRDDFFSEASEYLQQGNNIIMCPEGTSHWSKDSPGPFKSGAFRLAAMQNTETLVVPIVVANFDKPLSEAVVTAIIKQPIKVCDVIDPEDPHAMNTFLSSLRLKYKTYLTEAQYLARKY